MDMRSDKQILSGAAIGTDHASASDDSPARRLLFTLHLIERTVLPRSIYLDAGGTALYLDVVQQHLQIAPRAGDYYAVDEKLAHDAPDIHRALDRKRSAVRKAQDAISDAPKPVVDCVARTLTRHCSRATFKHRVDAAEFADVTSQLPIAPFDIYESALAQHEHAPGGIVEQFFGQVREQAREAWLVTRSGWVLAYPEGVRSIEELRGMTDAADAVAAWAPWATASPRPSLSFFSDPGQSWLWCVAADKHHVAQLLCTPAQWAFMLSAWAKAERQTPAL